MLTRWIAALLAALVLPMLALPALADVTGTVRGTVTIDGAATPGVRVTIAGDRPFFQG